MNKELPMSVDPVISICARIAAHAAAAPDAPAVSDGATRLTYAELEQRSRQLAAYLRESGAGPETCVGLLLDRSVDFVVSALAVLKSGAAYLPLDASTPADRAAFILADAGAPLMVTHRDKARGLVSGPWRIIELDGAAEQFAACRPGHFGAHSTTQLPNHSATSSPGAHPTTPPPHHSTTSSPGAHSTTPPPHYSTTSFPGALAFDGLTAGPAPESLAYVIYTSGSTGKPKGVELTHANLLNLVDWHIGAFGVTAADRASQVAGLGFDAAGWEIWPSLAAGASLHIADELTRRSPHALRDWLVAEKITISFVPTVLAEQLLHAKWPAGTALRTLLTGADTLHRRPASGLPFVLVNNYGPTECTVVATSGRVDPDAAADAPPSIGRPIANATAFILDEQLRPVPQGEPGELCLAGALVGRGYRNLPELTASRFVTFTPASGQAVRIYRTGDRARMLGNGEIAFLGRLDDQVKVRGYRIELGEIVACLDRYPAVEASAVTLRDAVGAKNGAPDAGPSLVAYVAAAAGASFTASDLREFLAARLPDYMVPTHFVTVASLPMTANGKLDKSALPAPAKDNQLPNRAAPAAPPAPADADAAPRQWAGAEFEKRIGSMVAGLLGQVSIDPQDDFFMLGGHSMLGAQLVARIRDTFGVKLTLRQLFGAPTVAALSVEVARLTEAASSGAVVKR
jgi:amino acid adenylation domain-containing protein